MLDAFAFQDVPFDRVMDELDPGVPKGSYGPTGGEPYFRVCVDFTEAPDGGAPAPAELGLAPFDTGGAVAGCDLYVSFSAGRGTLRGLVLYSAELFERRTVTAFVERLLAILGAFEGQLQRRLAEVRP
jgi:non-ribosomal peptide synthetase component F